MHTQNDPCTVFCPQKPNNEKLCRFFSWQLEQPVEQMDQLLVIWDTMALMWHQSLSWGILISGKMVFTLKGAPRFFALPDSRSVCDSHFKLQVPLCTQRGMAIASIAKLSLILSRTWPRQTLRGNSTWLSNNILWMRKLRWQIIGILTLVWHVFWVWAQPMRDDVTM